MRAGPLLGELRAAAAGAAWTVAGNPAAFTSGDHKRRLRAPLLRALLLLLGSSSASAQGAAREALVALCGEAVGMAAAMREVARGAVGRAAMAGAVAAVAAGAQRCALDEGAWHALSGDASAQAWGMCASVLRAWETAGVQSGVETEVVQACRAAWEACLAVMACGVARGGGVVRCARMVRDAMCMLGERRNAHAW